MAAGADLSAVFDSPFEILLAYAYAMPRLFGMFSMIPLLTTQAMPAQLRTPFVIGVSTFLLPVLIQGANVPRGSLQTMALLLKEGVVGMTLGLLVAIPLWAFEAMGAFVDAQRGASNAQSMSATTGHESSPLGELFSQAASTYLVVSGGLMLLIGAALHSFQLWPVFDALPRFDPHMPELLLGLLDRLSRLAVLMGSPVLVTMLLAELGLAVVSRFAPQMQVYFLAAGLKSGIAMFIFSVYAIALFQEHGPELIDMQHALDSFRAFFLPAK